MHLIFLYLHTGPFDILISFTQVQAVNSAGSGEYSSILTASTIEGRKWNPIFVIIYIVCV